MSQIQISLEGSTAIEVAQLLQAYWGEGSSYDVEDPSVVTQGETSDKIARVLITIKAIVDLTGAGVNVVGDAVDVAQKIRDFQSPPVTSALVIVGDQDIEFKNVTPAQILEIIRGIKESGKQ
jgi:hypothetical protein